jgi:hypothetical protein
VPKEIDLKAEAEATQRAAPQDYDAYLARKVDAARASMHAGVGYSNEEVEAEFAARRAIATN